MTLVNVTWSSEVDESQVNVVARWEYCRKVKKIVHHFDGCKAHRRAATAA